MVYFGTGEINSLSKIKYFFQQPNLHIPVSNPVTKKFIRSKSNIFSINTRIYFNIPVYYVLVSEYSVLYTQHANINYYYQYMLVLISKH